MVCYLCIIYNSLNNKLSKCLELFQTSLFLVCICSEVNGGTLKLNFPGSGVTQMEFSCDGTKLFCTYKLTNVLDCWDLRQTSQPLYSIIRSGTTKQRVHFDFLR